MNPFEFVKSINEKTYSFEGVDKKQYTSYIINKSFSFFQDTLYLANEINKYPDTPAKQHYDFLYYAVPKKKRYSKWIKQQKENDALLLSERLNIRYDRAVEIMTTLSESDLKKLKDDINIDGLRK